MKLVTISSKRQITIPKKLLESLGIGPQDKAVLSKIDDGLVLKPITGSVVEQTAGSLKELVSPKKQDKSFSEIEKKTRKKVAKYLAEK